MAICQPPDDFYLSSNGLNENLPGNRGSFHLCRAEEIDYNKCDAASLTAGGFHKISLLRGHNRYHFAGKSVDTSDTLLLFSGPQMPYTFEPLSNDTSGFCCYFRVPFLSEKMKHNISQLPLFLQKGKSSFQLSDAQDNYVSRIYAKMLGEMHSDYLYKSELLKNYVMELIHYALKISPLPVKHAG